MRKLLVALTLAALAGLAPISPAPPAAAHHSRVGDRAIPHWRSDIHPVVRTPSCYVWGNRTNFCNVVADAAYYWQNRGFDRGYTPPLPLTGYTRCDNQWAEGVINVCFVPHYQAELEGKVGATKWYSYEYFGGDPYHLHSAVIFVCADCPYTYGNENNIRIITVHEMGHALGLEHTDSSYCAMNDPQVVVYWWEGCQADADHLRAEYNHTD